MTVYSWRPGSRFGVPAQVVGEAIEQLHDSQDGPLSPERIVAAAEPARSALHPLFEWQDDVAAHRYRLDQARKVMQELRVTVVSRDGEVFEGGRFFVNVHFRGEQGYVTMVRAASDRFLLMQVLKTAIDELNAWRRRYAQLRDLAGVFAALDASMPDIDAMLPEMEDEPEPELPD